MIWIQSCEDDISTNMVIDWLISFEANWFRTNDEGVNFVNLFLRGDPYDDLQIFIKPNNDELPVNIADIKSYWYRRGHFSFGINVNDANGINTSYTKYLIEEIEYLKDFIFETLREKKHINSYLDNKLNKLIALHRAKQVGLNIPETHIITKKKDLLDLVQQQSIITKSIFNSTIFRHGDKLNDVWGTALLNEKILNEHIGTIEDNFFPTLIQTCVSKRFEVRTFFLKDKFYSSAIFSQNDPQTKVDFRNYNYARPNRVVPFQLPADIQEKMVRLSETLSINCGSADIIYGEDKKYYFLEINPVGQFYQVSHPCNYKIEKEIAQFLKN